MDAIKRLVATNKLKTSFLAHAGERKTQLFFNFKRIGYVDAIGYFSRN